MHSDRFFIKNGIKYKKIDFSGIPKPMGGIISDIPITNFSQMDNKYFRKIIFKI